MFLEAKKAVDFQLYQVFILAATLYIFIPSN